MAPLVYLSFRKVLLMYLVASAFFLSASSQAINDHHQLLLQSRNQILGGRRSMLADFEEEQEKKQNKPKKKSNRTTATTIPAAVSSSSNKNKTKLIKPNLSSTTKNQTKPLKTTTNSTKTTTLDSLSKKSELIIKKLNSTTSKSISKPSSSKNSTNTETKYSSDPLNIIKIKPSSSSSSLKNNKTTKPTSQSTKPPPKTQKQTTQQKPSWLDDDGDEEQDFVSEIRDLPIKFQKTLLPDLETISTTSKAYINKYNKEITKKYFNPIVGNKYASTIASILSFAFILIPLLLVSLVFNHFKAYFSLQKIIIFVQVYLSIYFTILCLSSMVTGLEPLKFLYATSRSTYVCLQVLQTLGYVLYLLMLLMYLVLVFSTDCGLGLRFLGLAQIFVGFAIGLHYYVVVFHRVVLRQPPKTNWKVHGIYATCFLVICLFNRAERRKKAYLEDGGEEGKKS